MIEENKIYRTTIADIANGRRLCAQRGGTRSGKTYSILQALLTIAVAKKKDIDVVSESMPHLKRGALHDFEEILENEEINADYNKTDHTFTFASGSVVRFFSCDDWGKVKGSRRDILYINEANRIPYETYRQLAVRATQSIVIDWNPDAEFWFELKGLANEYPPHVSTYKDNKFLSAIQVAEIESNKNDVEWWKVYGLGQIGKAQCLVFRNWEQCKEIPSYARLLGYGLDFGYVVDATAIVAVYEADGELYVVEECYEQGLTNDKIAKIFAELPQADIVADSAEMKSIQEIRNYGIRRIMPATKGGGSIAQGIDVIRRYKLNVTQGSLNVIEELRNYKYKEDKLTGELMSQPIDKYNHALDALRYICTEKLGQKTKSKGIRRISF